jgi:hypothetical protein
MTSSLAKLKYAKELIKKFGLDDCKTSKIPMTIDANLGVDEEGRSTDIVKALKRFCKTFNISLYRYNDSSYLFLNRYNDSIQF